MGVRFGDCTDYDMDFYGLHASIRAAGYGPDDIVGWDAYLITAKQMVESGRVDEAFDFLAQLPVDYPDRCFDAWLYVKDTQEMFDAQARILAAAHQEIRRAKERIAYEIIQGLKKKGA